MSFNPGTLCSTVASALDPVLSQFFSAINSFLSLLGQPQISFSVSSICTQIFGAA